MSRRSSDLDFGDVFGGPPRRSGVYDRQSGRADSFDSSAYPRGRSRGGEERSPFQKSTSSSGLVEKPVFGELSSPARRRHLADDFFDDIFHGSDQSGNSTPRRAEQDVFSPTPVSRVLSPNRPVPVGGSSLFPRHSLPVKTMKGVEYPFHSARIQPSTFKIEESGALDTPDFLNMPPYAEEILEEPPRNAGKLFNNVNPLSRQLSRDMDDTSSIESQSQKDRISLENYINSKQFHFSIYKWAGKGVSLNLPSNSKLGTDTVSRISRLAEVVIQSVDMPYDDDKTGVPNNQNENKDKTLPNDIHMESKVVTILTMAEDTSPPEIGLKNSNRDLTENSVLSGDGMMNHSNEDVPAFLHDPIKPESRNLSQLCSNHSEEKGIEERTRQTVPENLTGGLKDESNIKYEYKAKKRTQEENRTVQVEAAVNHGIQDLPAVSDDEVPGKKAKGKVKDFIKIFSQDGSPKRKATSETEDRKSKGKERTKSKVDEQINMSVTDEDEEVKDSYSKREQPSVTATVELNKTSKEDAIHHSPAISDVHTTDDDPSTRRDINLEPGTESVKESINISVEEFPYEDFEGCLVNEVVQNQDESMHAESEQDQIKAADVKIREWSKGKEGNIRSLLSTLQYVLWPESGWKPVPLVNIIEGSSVKRSYQRALLCLHPDKLQQRGAAMHQKYIAEKVFDILQEAWDQFNSLGVF